MTQGPGRQLGPQMWGFQMEAKDVVTIWKRNPCLAQFLLKYPFQGFLPSAHCSGRHQFLLEG